MNNDVVLACKNVGKSYVQGDAEIRVLEAVDLTVARGARIAVVGVSGAGKSTLLHLLGGLDQPTCGEVWIDGREVARLRNNELGKLRNRALGFVYQFHHLLPEFSALENVAMPPRIAGATREQANEQAASILQRVGLGQRLRHKPAELSGGERQRVAIARALVNAPQCVLADEPTGNLDSRTAERVYDLFVELNVECGASLVMVTHDETIAARMDQVWHLSQGRLSQDEF